MKVNDETVILMKPLTYMNNSGEAVGPFVNYYRLDPSCDILVVYDDIDLPVGKLRLREKGSSGGHNGVKSIIANLNTEQFRRIRVGVVKDGSDTKEWVLSGFNKEEDAIWKESILLASEACLDYINMPFSRVMEKYNTQKNG